jgi:hypothetical protein
MQIVRAVWRTQADLMAADPAFLAAATSMHVHLYKNALAPELDSVLGDFTEATFTGHTALAMTSGVQPVYYDALTGNLTILLQSPAGGLHWICTVTPVVPETIYGVYVTDTANAVLIGAVQLPTPQTISAAGQGIEVPDLTVQFLQQSPF